MSLKPDIRIRAQRSHRGVVTGYALDGSQPGRPLVVTAWIDGSPVGAAMADIPSEDLRASHPASPRHGFAFNLPPARLDAASRLEIRIANRDDVAGFSVDLKQPPSSPPRSFGSVAWSGGLRFVGWLEASGDAPPRIFAYVDETLVAEAAADRWRPGELAEDRPRRSFDLHLPQRFADGSVGRVHIRTDDGRDLAGSPVAFWAADGGLDAVLTKAGSTPGQRLQGAHFDRLLPAALPFDAYARHRDLFQPGPEPLAKTAKSWTVAVLAGDGFAATAESLETQALADWTCLAFSERRNRFSFDPTELAAFLAAHADSSDWFVFLLAGVRLDKSTLARFDSAAQAHPDAALIYSDREIETADGDLWPLALPAFDYERMLEQAYFAPAFALPRAAVERAVREGVEDVFRLATLVFDDVGPAAKALHLPGAAASHREAILAGAEALIAEASRRHLAARGLAADVTPASGLAVCRVRRRRAQKPSVSLIIPTRDRSDLLRACLQSILGVMQTAQTEIIVIDNESGEPEALDYLSELRRSGVTVLDAPGPFNFARLNNHAAAQARGDFLCFLNNDVVALDNQWLDEMLSRHADPTVGAVGAKLLWPSGVVQHGGVTLGVNFAPLHAFRDRLDGDPGYGGQLLCAHETGAVTAACMTTPRALFLETGGFDEARFPVNFNDVDYCLRLAARGLRIVFTPHAKLQHRESASRGRDDASDAAARFQRELRSLRSLWGEALIADPSYSPLLALSDPAYAALAHPPRALAPRFRATPAPRKPPSGY